METILEDSREESYSKLELREESGSIKKANEESIAEYSKLETVNIGPNLPKDTCKVSDATADSNENSEQTEGKKTVMDDKAINNNGDALQSESDNVEKGQQEETKGKPPLITITLDAQNER